MSSDYEYTNYSELSNSASFYPFEDLTFDGKKLHSLDFLRDILHYTLYIPYRKVSVLEEEEEERKPVTQGISAR